LPEVVVVSTPGSRIYVRDGVVYVKPRDGDELALSADVDLLVVATGAVSVSGRALRRLAELGVRLLVLGHRGHVVAELRPIDRINKTVEARLAQLRAKVEGWGLGYAAEMVRAKIVNQARLLRYLAKSRREPWLRDEAYRVEDEALELERLLRSRVLAAENIRLHEAKAARTYWQALAALLPADYGFTGRDPRGSDPVNMALSYGYAILYGVTHDALVVAGLDPYAGFLHTDRSGKMSLVFDYSDMFKPVAVDKALFTSHEPGLFDLYGGSLSYSARRGIAERVLKALSAPVRDGEYRRRPLRDHVYSYAWSLAEALRSQGSYRAFTVVF